MIVVDTNILAYLYLPTVYTEITERLLEEEPVWAVPYLWRSEFRNVLALYLRKKLVTLDQAIRIQSEAESFLKENEYESNSSDVLNLVNESSCSSYDCEFVSLARNLDVKLVTMDKLILKSFPQFSISLVEMF